MKVAALFVDPAGPYAGRANVDAWPESRDARLYAGPWPVVAHPPCGPWGKFAAAGRAAKDDGGCGKAAVDAVRRYGGVLEQPRSSSLFATFGLPIPPEKGWSEPDSFGGRSCRVDQSAYGHLAQKPTWLYAVLPFFPELDWRHVPGSHLIGRIDHYQNVADRSAAKANGTYVRVPELPRGLRHLTPDTFAWLLLGMAASCHFRASSGIEAGGDAK